MEKTEKNKWELSALDAYINRVYSFINLYVPILCIFSAAVITALYILGYYTVTSRVALVLFDISVFAYLATGIYLAKTGFGNNGVVLPEKLRVTKLVSALALVIYWNAISYICPFRDLWAYCIIFSFVLAVFFDIKLVSGTTCAILVSMFVSWFIKGDILLPPGGPYFNANLTFRLVGLVLMLLCVNIITLFGGRYFVEELERFVNYDPLTHLLNRRNLERYLQAAYKKAESGKGTFCLLLMDVDNLKMVNDTFGHECGDEALESIADIIARGVRKNDVVFRWGGEEILVLLYAEEYKAVYIADRIRKEIERTPIEHGDDEVYVTVTIGVAPYREGESPKDMMDKIERCLYYGKTHGKNQIVSMVESVITPFNNTTHNLTGLPNASGYMREVENIKNAGRLSEYSAFYFNLKKFGSINRDIGQESGDRLLKNYAEKLLQFIRTDEALGHLGGDNFMALIRKERQDEAITFLSRVETPLLGDISIRMFDLTASIGVWEIDDDNIAPSEIISRPSMALDQAKNVKHKNILVITDEQIERIRKQKSILADFKPALANGEFAVYYQPKVDTQTNTLVGAEGLVRWKKDDSIIPPDLFIPTLEESGEIQQLDYHILKCVCNDIKRWEKEGLSPVKVSVNVSRHDLADPDLAEKINKAIIEAGISRDYVEIEVTETTDEEEIGALDTFINSLKNYGISVAIDDFGAGYSSIATLRKFNISTLKFDKSFVDAKTFTAKDKVIFTDIAHLAQKLGLGIVVEGVERDDQLDFVTSAGCHIIQGYYYDKPLPADVFEDRLRAKVYPQKDVQDNIVSFPEPAV